MVLGILSSLASFSLKKPKLVMFIVVGIAIAGFGVHYKLIVGERDKLRIAEAGYEQAVAAFILREAVLKEDLRLAAEATAIVTAERNSNISALDALKRGRQIDPDARSWGKQALPIGEIRLLCETLPELIGCAE